MKKMVVIILFFLASRLYANPVDSLPFKSIVNEKAIRGWKGAQGVPIQLRCKVEKPFEKPLFVVDGHVYDDIGWLNPSDILKISILRNADSLALFGCMPLKAALIITTKKLNERLIVVKDLENDSVLAGATIKILPGGKVSDTMFFITDKNGRIATSNLANLKSCSAIVSCVGYTSKEVALSFEHNEARQIIQLEKLYKKMDDVVVIACSRFRCRICCGSFVSVITSMSPGKLQQLSKEANVYPNPVNRNGVVKIKLQRSVNGTVQLFSSQGTLINAGMIRMDAGKTIEYNLPVVSPGTYFIRINDERSKKAYSEKLIVQ